VVSGSVRRQPIGDAPRHLVVSFEPLQFTLSGFMVLALPWFSYVNPLRYYLVPIRARFLKGVGLLFLWPGLLALTEIANVLPAARILRFRKSLD
jgi:ABC-2 type transport system permease protein